MRTRIDGLDRYGLSLGELRSLKSYVATVSISVRWPPMDVLLPLEPPERVHRFIEFRRAKIDEILALWPGVRCEFNHRLHPLANVEMQVPAALIPRVLRVRGIHIRLDRIRGLRKRREPRQLGWFAVQARLAIQQEGQTGGLQQVERRTVLVRGYSEEDAVRRLEPYWKECAEPGWEDDGTLYRFLLEEIVGVERVGAELDPKGEEIWFDIHRRRMKPEYEWHPRQGE